MPYLWMGIKIWRGIDSIVNVDEENNLVTLKEEFMLTFYDKHLDFSNSFNASNCAYLDCPMESLFHLVPDEILYRMEEFVLDGLSRLAVTPVILVVQIFLLP